MRDLVISPSITDKQNKSIEKYFSDVARQELISAEDEVTLARKIRVGDHAALDKLVRANLRFVISVAKKYQHMGMPLEDLINEGNLGLITAARRFDETKGFKFISFAVWWIRQSIMHALGEHKRMVRLPTNHINLLTRIGHNAMHLEGKLERTPTSEELAEFLNIEQYKVEDAIFYSGRTISYDCPLSWEDEYALIEKLPLKEPGADQLVNVTMAEEGLNQVLGVLTKEERTAVEYRFGFRGGREHSLREIGEIMGFYPELARLTLKRAMAKLKQKSSGWTVEKAEHEDTLIVSLV